MSEFLHGVRTSVTNVGPVSIAVARTAVIGIVGIAPTGPRQTLTLVRNANDASQFGTEIPGFSIPEALRILVNKYGASPILVANVFDPTTHTVAVVNESITVGTGGRIQLANTPVEGSSTLTITTTGETPVTLIPGVHYSLSDYGRVRIIARTTYPDGTTLRASYSRLDQSSVTSEHIIGAMNTSTGHRTGMFLFEIAENIYGFKPKILIAPQYSSINSVANALIAASQKYRAEAYIDAPVGSTVNATILARGPFGGFNFNYNDPRAILCYPMHKATNPFGSVPSLKNIPASIHEAGLRNKVDRDLGFWYSTSNQNYVGLEGVERYIQWSLADTNSEANALNAAGIKTTVSGLGTGFLAWGNRNASFPDSTLPQSFSSIQRVIDAVRDSLEQAARQFIDRPINEALITLIKESGNAFLNTLIGRGALITGSEMFFDRNANPATEIAQGKLRFGVRLMGPPPLETLEFELFIDINLLNNIIPS